MRHRKDAGNKSRRPVDSKPDRKGTVDAKERRPCARHPTVCAARTPSDRRDETASTKASCACTQVGETAETSDWTVEDWAVTVDSQKFWASHVETPRESAQDQSKIIAYTGLSVAPVRMQCERDVQYRPGAERRSSSLWHIEEEGTNPSPRSGGQDCRQVPQDESA